MQAKETEIGIGEKMNDPGDDEREAMRMREEFDKLHPKWKMWFSIGLMLFGCASAVILFRYILPGVSP